MVREHVSLVAAGLFTFLVFSVWAFNLPSKFSGVSNSQPAEIFTTLKDEIAKPDINLEEVVSEFKEVTASSSELSDEEQAEIIFEDSTTNLMPEFENEESDARPIRIATTSSASSTPEG